MPKKPLLLRVVNGILAAALLLLLPGCGSDRAPVSAQYYLLNTVCTVTLYDKEDADCLTGAFDLVADYEGLLSRTIETSDIARINAAGGAPCAVAPETAQLITLALEYAALSGGRFDPTVGAAAALWDFSAETPALPGAAALAAAAATIDYRGVTVAENVVTLQNPGAQLDLGAIAKGHIADRVKDYLESRGVKSAIIDLGGNILTVGGKPDGSPFRVGVRRPFADGGGDLLGQAEIRGLSMVTSGVYERGFVLDSVRYHHILDPDTGMPVETDIVSVTVFSERSVVGDALSTTCLLLGSDAAMELVEGLDGIEAVLLLTDGTIRTSAGMGTVIPFE